MEDENPLAKEVIEHFDEENRISKKHEIYNRIDRKFASRSEKIKKFRKKYRFALIVVILLGLILAGLAIAGYIQGVPTPEVPEAEDIFDSIANWWNYDLWDKDLPVQETSTLRLAAGKHAIIACILLFLALIVLVIRPIINKYYLKSQKRKEYMVEWCEFRYLMRLFEYAEEHMF